MSRRPIELGTDDQDFLDILASQPFSASVCCGAVLIALGTAWMGASPPPYPRLSISALEQRIIDIERRSSVELCHSRLRDERQLFRYRRSKPDVPLSANPCQEGTSAVVFGPLRSGRTAVHPSGPFTLSGSTSAAERRRRPGERPGWAHCRHRPAPRNVCCGASENCPSPTIVGRLLSFSRMLANGRCRVLALQTRHSPFGQSFPKRERLLRRSARFEAARPLSTHHCRSSQA